MKITPLVSAVLGLVTLPALAAPAPSFRDVPPGHWAANAVRSLAAKGVVKGYASGTFQGNRPATRYELALTLDRFIKYIEAGRKPLSPTAARPVAAPAHAPAEVKRAFADLSGGAFLPPNSPVFAGGGGQPVTAQQVADALAQVTIRLSDRSLPPQKD